MNKWLIVSVLLGTLILSGCGAETYGEDLSEVVEAPEAEVAEDGVAEAEEAREVAQETAQETTEEQDEDPLTPAVDFTMTDWQGAEISLSDYEGKIVFLNFFATWCPPCQAEMPEFQQAYEDYQGDVVFLIVDVFKSEKDGYQNVVDWYTEGGYTMPMIIDEEDYLSQFYPVRAFPTTFVINREGNVLGYLEGAMDREMVDMVIAQVDE